jgi:hypothetical protein
MAYVGDYPKIVFHSEIYTRLQMEFDIVIFQLCNILL